MFEITGRNISDLNDVDLRTLVAKLCEAELRRAGLPVSSLTAGGDQNAADGGLDVRVFLEPHDKQMDFIPRPSTGFQVKVPDMPRGEILKEMCPEGTLRPVIRELASMHGAYIIVSSHGSTADGPLRNRVAAMREALRTVSDLPENHVDFYDRERLATWVRQYAGIAAWVRERLGERLLGWQPYGNWSGRSDQAGTEYLSDEKSRLYDAQCSKGEKLTVGVGITRMREVLARPGGVVRLIGLSGVGKTRLVEALFDVKVGENALDPAVAVYTDIADEPTPSPRDLIQHFNQCHQRAIVVVDNCPPDTHQSLVKINSTPGSSVSLITVEYDVGEDEPEGTEVFRLEAASEGVIELLIERVASHVSQVDRRRISEFSGGNARIALAVVRTIRRSESVARLSDEDLFQRLFRQRHSEDPALLRAGEVCSLVYSFDGEAAEGQEAELPILAELAGLSVSELFRHVQELKSRDLIQQRSKWRAVLPHALANKLAQRALERIMPATISTVLVGRAPARLLQSFSRRLGYLHHCRAAQTLVEEWLSVDGLLGRVEQMSPLGLATLRNIAPVAPAATLEVIERMTGTPAGFDIADVHNPERYRLASLIAALAYDAELFERAVELLARFVIAEPPGNNHSSASRMFNGLFQLYLSGTHASVQQRLRIIDGLLSSTASRTQEVGLGVLNNMLRAWSFSSHHDFKFGARSRDYGWRPRTYDEVTGWYREVLKFVLIKIASGSRQTRQLASIVADNFRGLWIKAKMFDELEDLAEKIAESGSWAEGWIRVRKALKFDTEEMPEAVLKRLQGIETLLHPEGLLDQAKAYVLSPHGAALDIAEGKDEDVDDVVTCYRLVNEKAEELGRQIASESVVLDNFLPDLMQGSEGGRRWNFGVGLASGAESLDEMWQKLRAAFAAAPEKDKNATVLRGFLSGAACQSSEKVAEFLDAAITDTVLGRIFPYLQCAVDIDEQGMQRLFDSLGARLAPIWMYKGLAAGRATDSILPTSLQRFLSKLAVIPEGSAVAIDFLHMKFFALKGDGLPIPDELISCGQEILLRYDFSGNNSDVVYEISEVLKVCLDGTEAEDFANDICHKLYGVLSDYSNSAFDCSEIIVPLLTAWPKITLNVFLLQEDGDVFERISYELCSHEKHPLEQIPRSCLLDWANEDPQIRFPALASAARLFVGSFDDQAGELSPLARALIDAAPVKRAVLDRLQKSLRTMGGWSGSLAAILDKRRTALEPLKNHPDSIVALRVVDWDRKLAERAAEERLRERREDERFE